MRERFTPHPNVYYVYGLLSRFTAKNSDLLVSNVHGGTLANEHWRTHIRHVFAAALRSPAGHVTLAVVNDAEHDWDASIHLRQLEEQRTLHRYQITPAQRDQVEVVVEPQKTFVVSSERCSFTDRLPARSLTVYSTYRLEHKDAGVFAEVQRSP
jgi:alpha-L-arabinofuranosidase